MLIKIKQILETGKLDEAEEAIANPLVIAVDNLTKVYSIGYKTAIKLYNEQRI